MNSSFRKGSLKGTIVCIHGNSSSPNIFDNILHSREIKHTKIAIELLGHNEKDRTTKIEAFCTKNYCNYLLDFINDIEDDIFLIGNSLGGHLAIEIAKNIERLKGLMIFGTPPVEKPINFEEAFMVVPALQTFLTENPTDSDIENAAKVAVHSLNNVETIVNDFKKANPLVRSSLAMDLTNNNWSNQRGIFLNLAVAKFIIRGKQDPTVNPEYLNAIKNENNDCELISIDNCGHYPTLEQPEKFIEILQKASKKVFKA